MAWYQNRIQLDAFPRGLHLITHEIAAAMPELADVSVGLLHVFILHTSASLTINENADPDVPLDLESSLNAIAPEDFPHRHTMEGPDDMPAHIRGALTDVSLAIPASGGRMVLGAWQGIYLFEHRRRAHRRKIALHAMGGD